MKYFLAIDNDSIFNNKERYSKIDLNKLSNILGNNNIKDNNNLNYLCKFTMTFNDAKSLNDFLINKGIINKRSKLVISYEINKKSGLYTNILEIPYKIHEAYFNYSNLANIIKYNIKNKDNFLNVLLDFYKNKRYLNEAYFEIYKIKMYSLSEAQIFEIVRKFIREITYPKGKYSFKAFYGLAMLVAKFDNPNLELPKEDVCEDVINLDNIKWSNWQDRKDKENDLQLRLF